jgi:hypothetical protein
MFSQCNRCWRARGGSPCQLEKTSRGYSNHTLRRIKTSYTRVNDPTLRQIRHRHPVEPSSSPRILPESQTSRRTAIGRGPQHPGTVNICQGLSASLCHTVFVIGPEVTSPGKTSRQVLATFFVTSYIGASFSFSKHSFLGRVEGRKDPEDLPWIRTP